MYSCRAVFAFVLVLGSVELSMGSTLDEKLKGLDEKIDGLKDLGPSARDAPTGSDCADLLRQGVTKNGVYTVTPKQGDAFDVYCDMTTDGGGWTVFQKRFDGSVDFYLDWAAYKTGFGDLSGEFWLGNDKIHILTNQAEYELRVELMDIKNVTKYAVYDSVSISSESDNYKLSLGSYSGTAGDSLRYHNGMGFSTKDRDNDIWSSRNCATIGTGAWWYKICYFCNLNGQYNPGSINIANHMTWLHFHDRWEGLKASAMMIRPVK